VITYLPGASFYLTLPSLFVTLPIAILPPPNSKSLAIVETSVTRLSKRKHQRLPYQGKVDLFFPDHQYRSCSAQNLSMIGMWVKGCLAQGEGDQCDIEFHDATDSTNHPLRLKGEVIRRDGEGLALFFINLNVRTYGELEAFFQALGDPPLLEENEFLANLTA